MDSSLPKLIFTSGSYHVLLSIPYLILGFWNHHLHSAPPVLHLVWKRFEEDSCVLGDFLFLAISSSVIKRWASVHLLFFWIDDFTMSG